MRKEVTQEQQEQIPVIHGIGLRVIPHLGLDGDDLLPHSHEGDGPQHGPAEGYGDEEVGDEDDPGVLADGGAGGEEVDGGEGDAGPDGAGVADEDCEEDGLFEWCARLMERIVYYLSKKM